MTVELTDHGEFDVRVEPSQEGAFSTFPEGTRHLRIIGEREVDPSQLVKVDDIFSAAGAGPGALATTADDGARLVEGAHFIAGAIAFATGVALQVSATFGEEFRNEFVPETDRDSECLKELGTRYARIPLAPLNVVETIGRTEVDATLIASLASRKIASVYADALGELSPSARFFSLWRTLEFAFRAEGKNLVSALLDFPEVPTMEFDRPELEVLRAVRGRLGHARSSSGYGEILEADALAIQHLGRLWSLVDWVVSSKLGPGRDHQCDPLAELTAYIDREGRVRMVDGEVDPVEWVESWSRHSPRFNP